MTQEEILELAKQAGGMFTELPMMDAWLFDDKSLEAFAQLVAAKERDRIIAKNSPEIERCNAHIKMLEDAVSAERDRWMQLFLDPENQPTQFGTDTQEYREQEIKAEREACADMVFRYISQTTDMVARGCLASVDYDIRNRGEA
jgi:hypothetical protein